MTSSTRLPRQAAPPSRLHSAADGRSAIIGAAQEHENAAVPTGVGLVALAPRMQHLPWLTHRRDARSPALSPGDRDATDWRLESSSHFELTSSRATDRNKACSDGISAIETDMTDTENDEDPDSRRVKPAAGGQAVTSDKAGPKQTAGSKGSGGAEGGAAEDESAAGDALRAGDDDSSLRE